MKEIRDIMGMPAAVELADKHATRGDAEAVFAYFDEVDRRFSTYRDDSEISSINRGELAVGQASGEMREILRLAEETKRETNGFFDIKDPRGHLDPSGLVKGWAIREAARLLERRGLHNFYVDVGGDVEVRGLNAEGKPWQVGIRNPLKRDEIVKVLALSNCGIATSGAYLRGAHIYDPHAKKAAVSSVASVTVIGTDVYEADRFATAAYAMGEHGIAFIASRHELEGYAIDTHGIATFTPGFAAHAQPYA
jgi:thiamine biosynthesis lipoprotein